MSKKINDNKELFNLYKRNVNMYKRKLRNISLYNNSKIINSKINEPITHCFAKTSKNSPRAINASKSNNLRNRSFNMNNFSKQSSKSNLKFENSLDSIGAINNLRTQTKYTNLNIKTINMNIDINKDNNNDYLNQNNISFITNCKTKYINLKNQIHELLNNNSNIKKEKNLPNKDNNSRINASLYRLNKSKDLLINDKISPIKNKSKCFSFKKKNDINNKNKNNILFNSLKSNYIKKNSHKKNYKENYMNKIKKNNHMKDKDIIKNTTPKQKKEKVINKTKFNEVSFKNIPKIFQFNNSKKQTRNINYHKKQPSFSLTKTSNISQYNFLDSNSLENMLSQASINKNQISTSNYNNSTTISNEKSSQNNNMISIYNKLIKENNELKQNNYILDKGITNANTMINILKNILTKIIHIYKTILNNIINKYKQKEKEMGINLKIYNSYIKNILYYSKYYSMNEINNNKKIVKMIQQTLTENKILRNLYNNLLLFDMNNTRLYTNQSESYEEIEKKNIIISMNNISNRDNKFLGEENNERKRSDTAEQKIIKYNILDKIGKNNPQSRNYENKNELNANIINDNKNLQKCFIKKLNYKIKRK